MEIDYPNLVWEMYATDPEGERVYCGCSDSAKGANLFKTLLDEAGFTDFKKQQVTRGNHGQSLLPRVLM